MCGKVLPTGGARRANFLFQPANKVMTLTHTYTTINTLTQTHTQNCVRFGQSEQRAAPCENPPASSRDPTESCRSSTWPKRRKQQRRRGRRWRGELDGWCASAGVANYAKYLYASKARKIFAIYLSHVPHSPSRQKAMSKRRSGDEDEDDAGAAGEGEEERRRTAEWRHL